jgi:hypothetical protein
VTDRGGLAVTTLERTLCDIAATHGAKQLKASLRQSERLHRLDLVALRAAVDEFSPHSSGHARVRHVLNAYVPGTAATESELEAAFLELCSERNLPRPQTQGPGGSLSG